MRVMSEIEHHPAVADFDHNQADHLFFSGYGTAAQGATLQQIGSTDQWQIHSGLDAHNETITFSNHAAVQAGDFEHPGIERPLVQDASVGHHERVGDPARP